MVYDHGHRVYMVADKGAGNDKRVKAVMFIPLPKHSELAARLRDSEMKMEELTGYRIKIVERGGTKLVDILHKANPWAGEDCKRESCLLCRKEFQSHTDFTAGILSLGCACEYNTTLGMYFLLLVVFLFLICF